MNKMRKLIGGYESIKEKMKRKMNRRRKLIGEYESIKEKMKR